MRRRSMRRIHGDNIPKAYNECVCSVLLTSLAQERTSLKISDLEPRETKGMRPRPLRQPPGKLEAQAVLQVSCMGSVGPARGLQPPAPSFVAQVAKVTHHLNSYPEQMQATQRALIYHRGLHQSAPPISRTYVLDRLCRANRLMKIHANYTAIYEQ